MKKTTAALLAALTLTALFASCDLILDIFIEDDGDGGGSDSTLLSSLTVSYAIGGNTRMVNLGPEFGSATTVYNAYILSAADSITVTASTATTGATVTVSSGVTTQTGTNSVEINLDGGTASASIVATAPDGQSSRSYTLTIHRFAGTKTFKAYNIQSKSLYDVPATLRAAGQYCVVYVETARLGSVSEALAQSIADEFDLEIHAKMRSSFGKEYDVDSNGVVTLFLLDIIDGYSGGGYVAGYFFSDNMYSKLTKSYSNEADMLYMDIDPATPGNAGFFGTLAHEFQHLINFSNTVVVNGQAQDLWINEGLSSGAEYIYAGSQIQSRVDWFNNDPEDTISHGNNFFVWDGYWENHPETPDSILDNYATVYLFFQWLRIHATNGSMIYKDVLSSNYRDYRAVTNAAKNRIGGAYISWEVLIRTWLGANYLCLGSGHFGYAGEVTLFAPLNTRIDLNGDTWSFSPGEGMYRAVGEPYSPTSQGSNIRYVGLTVASSTLDLLPPYSGSVVLTFHASSNIAGADEDGSIAPLASIDIIQSLMSRSLASSSYTPPASYAVDVSFGPGGGLHPDSHKPRAASTGKSFDKTMSPFSAEAKRAWSEQ